MHFPTFPPVHPPADHTYGNPVQPRSETDAPGAVGRIYVEGSQGLTVPESGSIFAWRLFTETDYIVTMVVLRPSGPDTFTVVGENTVSIRGNITNIISVPQFARIQVQPGDVVGWIYLPGTRPAIP